MTLPRRRSPWVLVPSPRLAARLRLICLPYAGGNASAYRQWQGYLPGDVEILAVQLPGREDRFSEPAIASVDVLVDGLVDGLSTYRDQPFALFEHSMGALIAFELARRLRTIRLEPVHLFASGFRAPHLRADGRGTVTSFRIRSYWR